MHLSSITIKGFKSFPERTRLVFSPGVSVIVGPNGCGKSNVTDAVLWALGEQSPSSVRGQSMQDMIFAGGEGRGPSRYAEVEVVLDNADGEGGEFSEIAVRRRHDRSGEGEYRLNGARCRLADVIEALSDANLGREMHSVISQGRVEEIVHSKPRDRRLLVEEAAGLGKHRKRRRRAQLKLERTQDNLDRALDVEREARSRLRPLKRQAQAADIHARLERDAAELRGTLLSSQLASGGASLTEAEEAAAGARAKRDEIEAELAEVNKRRTAIEERLAARDRDRTEAWGRLTAVRAAHERLTVRAEALAARRRELSEALERGRATLGALADEIGRGAAAGGGDPIDAGLERIGEALSEAGLALGRARTTDGEDKRAMEVAGIREATDRAGQHARRIEGLLGERRQDSLERRIERDEAILVALDALCEAVADARDAAGERSGALEQRMLGGSGDADEVAAELRECSQAEAGLQTRLRGIAESVTEAEVSAAHLRDRREETMAEIERVEATLKRKLEPADAPLADSEREEIERKLDRLANRREQLGPVNPLAEREYADALEHVTELEEQRTDLEGALAELQSLIRETDAKIESAFEQTFEATERNFEELVEHLFPGGRGRLRLVGDKGPRLVLGGQDPPQEEGTVPTAEEAEDADESFTGQGVEIEVTPAGKATRKLSLLSGGEKSLVALAFVFAVFLARPSPFYILDEVEAALDDANIDRFLQLVTRFADRAQFIIVTHQKRTMDAADVLYGVSMGSGGVTKVISRRMPRDDEGDQPELAESESGLMPRDWRDVFELGDAHEPAEARAEEAEERSGVFKRLREGLARSRKALQAEISSSVFERLDSETWELLEEALILADVGAPTTADIVGRLEAEVDAGELADGAAVRERLIELMAELAEGGDWRIDLRARPAVLMVVGVNGTGKTTTIGKLAWHLERELGLDVLVAAADTYRAAAVEQLETWAERSGAEIVRGTPGGDAGAVVYDAIEAAQARGADVVIADTAGRLHTHGNLMEELSKVTRVASKSLAGAPHETLIVIDATTGQNGLRQAKAFADAVEVTGVVLTKLDGTAKGGIALAIARELGIPVKLIGVGESLEDLRPFEPREFAEALLAE